MRIVMLYFITYRDEFCQLYFMLYMRTFLLRILKTTYVHTPTNKMQIQIRLQNMVMMKN